MNLLTVRILIIGLFILKNYGEVNESHGYSGDNDENDGEEQLARE